jgi:hypothetical protein
MAKTVVGLYDRYSEAQSAVQDLIDNGFRRDDISLVSNDETHRADRERMVGTDESAAAEGAGAGAVGGSVLGGALGLLVGAGLLAIPGVGPVLAAGPLAAAIGTTAATVGAGALGAGIGAATGGLMGGLIGAGVPKEDAEFYAEGVRRGGTLVSVSTDDAMATTAHSVMLRHNAVDIDQRTNEWRTSGWTGYDTSTVDTEPMGSTSATTSSTLMDTNAGPYKTDTAAFGFDQYDNDYRTHYQSAFGSAGYTYDDYKPVYQYGYSLAGDRRYVDRDWADIEPDARTRWEEHNPGTWEQFKDAVRYAWDRARGVR